MKIKNQKIENRNSEIDNFNNKNSREVGDENRKSKTGNRTLEK